MGIPDQSKWVGIAPVEPSQSIPVTVDFEHVNNEQAFIVGYSLGAPGALYSYYQLLNPAGSGVVAYVTKVHVNTITGSAVRLYLVHTYDTLLTTLIGKGINKYLGKPASETEMRYQNSAAYLGVGITWKELSNLYVIPDWEFKPPLRLDPGKGILTLIYATNLATSCTFEWIEI